MPTALFIRGLPASFKTTLSSNLPFLLIEPEQIDTSFIIGPSATIKKYKYRSNLKLAIEALSDGKSIVWTQPWSNVTFLHYTIDNIQSKCCGVTPIIVELCVEWKISCARWIKRQHLKDTLINRLYYYLKFVKTYQDYKIKNFIYFKIIENDFTQVKNEFNRIINLISFR